MRDLECTDEQKQFCSIERITTTQWILTTAYIVHLAKWLMTRSSVPTYELVLIDEFQDFNRLEASVIDIFSEKNSIVVAGDDDQALYSQLRSASWDHIRERYESGHYEVFELPFCMRCPEVIVGP